jgi:hypothetical protein
MEGSRSVSVHLLDDKSTSGSYNVFSEPFRDVTDFSPLSGFHGTLRGFCKKEFLVLWIQWAAKVESSDLPLHIRLNKLTIVACTNSWCVPHTSRTRKDVIDGLQLETSNATFLLRHGRSCS